MTPSRTALSIALRTALAGALLAIVASLRAADGGFSATLSAEQRTAAGLAGLTPAELAALDRLVAGEVAQARQDNLRELDGTFCTRRTGDERREAGLDRLAPWELAKINDLVAAAIAASPRPRERPRLKESDVLGARNKPEIHGSVSLAYGWGGGGDYRASSFWLDYFDPESGLGLGVGFSNFTGDGFYGYYPGYYDTRYYSQSQGPAETSARGAMRDNFDYGTGQSFRSPAGGGGPGGGHRGH